MLGGSAWPDRGRCGGAEAGRGAGERATEEGAQQPAGAGRGGPRLCPAPWSCPAPRSRPDQRARAAEGEPGGEAGGAAELGRAQTRHRRQDLLKVPAPAPLVLASMYFHRGGRN